MSHIRTLLELQDAMSQEFAWRKKELHSLRMLVIANEKHYTRDLHIRSAVTLLYAHWEGFIKQISRYYLEFVGRRRLKNDELSPNFLAMALASMVRKAASSDRIQPCLDIVQFFNSDMSSRSRLEWEYGVNTKGNLRSDVFREVVATLGLDYSRFATKEKLIDEKLVHVRNNVAHGRFIALGFQEYLDLHGEMIGVMQDFYNQVDNSANAGSYRV